MNRILGVLGVLAIAAVAMTAATAQVVLPNQPHAAFGDSVTPSFEGWFDSADGTAVMGWRNDASDGPAVVISNGLGTGPAAWPDVTRDDSGFRVATWYYRGTGGGARPADRSRVAIEDHVEDLLALMDHEGMEQALLACWSLGVNVGFEFARAHPDRVAGRKPAHWPRLIGPVSPWP